MEKTKPKLKFKGYPHVLKSQQFDRLWVENILFPLSDKIKELLEKNPRTLKNLLKGKTLVSIFASESSRTRASLEIGFCHMGGTVAFSSPNANISGAMGKGESFYDTLHLFDNYHCDLIAARNDSPKEMTIEAIAKEMTTPVINAGDGAGRDKQHPTQALLDIYTIYKYFGKIDGLSIAMIGDLKNGRTIRSLCYLLGKWKVKHIYLVSPKELKVDMDIKKYLKAHNTKFSEHRDLKTIAQKADVFYQTRTQTNLGSPRMTRHKKGESTVINKEILDLAKKQSIIMHPLPCLDEIDRKVVDKDPRGVYMRGQKGYDHNKDKTSPIAPTTPHMPSQIYCGLITRMALMLLILRPKKSMKLIKNHNKSLKRHQ